LWTIFIIEKDFGLDMVLTFNIFRYVTLFWVIYWDRHLFLLSNSFFYGEKKLKTELADQILKNRIKQSINLLQINMINLSKSTHKSSMDCQNWPNCIFLIIKSVTKL
jgi:hypothetical protein